MELIILLILGYFIIKQTSTTPGTGTGALLSNANKTASTTAGLTGTIQTSPNNFVSLASSSGLVYNALTGTMVNKTNNQAQTSGNGGTGGVSSTTAQTGVSSQNQAIPASAFYPGTNELIQYDYNGDPLSYADAYGGNYANTDPATSQSSGVLLSDANTSDNTAPSLITGVYVGE
jgi:hypothetical protein